MDNYYDILGVDKKATQDEIKKAFRDLSKKYHPDINKDEGAEDMFKKINEAHSVLGDEKKRKEYDDQLSGKRRNFNPFDRFNGFEFNFGGGGFRQMASDINMVMTISIEDVYYGCTRQIRVGMKHYNINVPKGTLPGQTLRLKGLGVKGVDVYGQEKTGDLLINIRVQNTDNMWLDEDGTLEMMTSIDWTDAILGSEQTIELFDKYITFKTPKYCQNGGRSLVKGKGIPIKGSDTCGDIRMNYIVKMPKSLTDEQLELLKKIKGGQ